MLYLRIDQETFLSSRVLERCHLDRTSLSKVSNTKLYLWRIARLIDCVISGTSRIRLPFNEDHGFTDLTSDYAREFREEIFRTIKSIAETLEQLFVFVCTWSWYSRQFVHADWFLLLLPLVRIPQPCNVELWFGIPSSTFFKCSSL
jgi:hypothetical protein